MCCTMAIASACVCALKRGWEGGIVRRTAWPVSLTLTAGVLVSIFVSGCGEGGVCVSAMLQPRARDSISRQKWRVISNFSLENRGSV